MKYLASKVNQQFYDTDISAPSVAAQSPAASQGEAGSLLCVAPSLKMLPLVMFPQLSDIQKFSLSTFFNLSCCY